MKPVVSHPLRLADLPQRKLTRFRLVPDERQLDALADRLVVDALRKVRLEGTLRPGPGRDWTLEAELGATVIQPCRVTTAPVTTRIEIALRRQYVADFEVPDAEEVEMAEDDEREPLPAMLDIGDVLEEALALEIPEFPRVEDAEDLNLRATPPGAEPLDDEAIKPFAGLADLKKRMEGEG